MKIDIIGAAYPYRGGNAHYTSLLYLNLQKKHTVKLYTYKRQYPLFLYPGKTDKDQSAEVIKIDQAIRSINYANPFTWYSTYKKIKEDSPDLVIFNWFTPFTAFQFWMISALIKKFTSIKILFICHNVIPHEPSFLDKLLTNPVLKKGNFFIVHSTEDVKNLHKLLPEANVMRADHPIYDIFSSGSIKKDEAKNKLGLKGNVLLFFGFIRKYKGLEYLIRALPLIQKKLNTNLLIVGEFWEGRKKYEDIISDLGLSENIKIIDEYVPNEDVGLYFSACDLVVLPYVTATGSGILQIANSFNKPSIATKTGCFIDMIEDKKTGYLVSPEDPSSIADAVIDFFENPENEKIFNENIENKKKEFSWDKLTGTIEELFQTTQ